VSASLEVQRHRLRERDGLSDAEIEKRIASQMPLAEKEARADYVIFNNGSLDDLRRQTVDFCRAWRMSREAFYRWRPGYTPVFYSPGAFWHKPLMRIYFILEYPRRSTPPAGITS